MSVATSNSDQLDESTTIDIWKMPLLELMGGLVFFGLALTTHIALNSDKEDVGLDALVLVKLAFAGSALLLGINGFLSDLRVRAVALSWPAILIPVIFCLYVFSSLLSSSATEALVSTSSIIAVYLLTITVAIQLGRIRTLEIIFYGSSLFVIGSWLLYFAKPEIGVFLEPVTDGGFTRRMSGLSHPNTLGQFCGLNLAAGIVLYVNFGRRNLLFVGLCVVALAALVNCLSKASALALFFAIIVAYRHFFLTKNLMKLMLAGAILLAFASVFYLAEADVADVVEEQMAMLSKSGDAEEITSGTGRSQIWAKSISLIRERPAVGYGPATSKKLLVDYSGYTHNLILNVVLSSGLFGGVLVCVMCLSRIAMMFRMRNAAADALATFVLINGLVENTIFSTICGLPTACWVLGLVWFAIGNNLKRHE